MANDIKQVTLTNGAKANLGDIEKAAIRGVEQGANAFSGANTFSAANVFSALNTFSSNLAVDGALELGIQAVTAAGSDQSDGGAISATGGVFVNATGADNTKCVVLPLLSSVNLGHTYLIFNNAASNTLEVFGGVGDDINPAGDNTAVTIAADTIMLCVALDATQWVGAELPVIAV